MEQKKRDIRIVFFLFSGIIAMFAWKAYPSIQTYVLCAASLLLLLTVIFSPLTLEPLFQLWLKAAHTVGRFNTRILLTVIFVLFFIPTGIVMRLLGKDPMKRKVFSNGTYWEPCELEGLKDRNRYERQF